MSEPINRRLRVGFLGMPDNISTRIVLTELGRAGVVVDVVLLMRPDRREQWKRIRRKLAAAGILATLRRGFFALRQRASRKSSQAPGEASAKIFPDELHTVDSFNGTECRKILKAANLDLLLLCTDSMIGRGTYQIPRLGTLNAHPGWIPAYRGLGSMVRQLGDGFQPAISVHKINEGVDTGPVIHREIVEIPLGAAEEDRNQAIYREQGRMFARTVKLFEQGQAEALDTFDEPSSMARGVAAAEAGRIWARVAADSTRLRPPFRV